MISKFIVEAIEGKKYKDTVNGACCLCGNNNAPEYFERKKVLSGCFTDYNNLKIKSSDKICLYCTKILSDKYMTSPKGKSCGLRLFSFIIDDDGYREIQYSEKEFYVMEFKPSGKYVLCMTDSGKKHISWKSNISIFEDDIIKIYTEDGVYTIDRKKYRKVYLLCKLLYDNGVKKDNILYGEIGIKKINSLIKDSIINYKDLFYIRKFKDDANFKLIISSMRKEVKND